ncbi:DinB family protein [Jiangella aurantiaca]|uniref:DinB family protein n=1 Tax=Jiangella aurantiaca TaxID=2530373 RepID=A0A4R5A697_9ACTN|nr:DinB family protein [Jiangella aurantiaca]TDD66610.1 DinB family protein [Jiangella aurantiaca]
MLDEKDTLKRYLQSHRDALLWKLDGLSERDARWPMTPTGTNLLGLVKHVASMEYDYFGRVFDRPVPEPMPWLDDDAEDNADLWATADQSREWVVDFYRRAIAHADATIDALDLDDTGTVPWWPAERNPVTLHQILVHMIAETARHAGHADIVRETVDGEIGLRKDVSNLPDHDAQWWSDYVEKLKRTALEAENRLLG